jgi:cysteine synthase
VIDTPGWETNSHSGANNITKKMIKTELGKTMYEKVIAEEFERALGVPLNSIEFGGNEIILFRADTLEGGVKTSIGKCLLAHYLETGIITGYTKAVVVQGAGNTVTAVKKAAEELVPHIEIVAVVYAETSQSIKNSLKELGIRVVSDSSRREGRDGRLSVAQRLCRREGYVFIEQHEQPLIKDIQSQTFGRVIVQRLENIPTHFVAGVGTGGTVFGIGSALRRVNSNTRVIAVEGVGSTLTLWHAYLKVKGQGYEIEKAAIEEALAAYRSVGMIVSLECYPNRSQDEWFDISIGFPDTWTGVVGIEGLGVGDPTNFIFENLLSIDSVRIVTDEQASAGIKALELNNIRAVESAGANFFTAMQLAPKIQCEKCRILTVVTARE